MNFLSFRVKDIPIWPFVQHHWQPVFQDTNTWERLFCSHRPVYGVGQKFGTAHMILKLLVWEHLNLILLIRVNKWNFLMSTQVVRNFMKIRNLGGSFQNALCIFSLNATSFNGPKTIWWFMKIRALCLNPVDNRVCCKFRRTLVGKIVRFIDSQHVTFGKTNSVFSSQVL